MALLELLALLALCWRCWRFVGAVGAVGAHLALLALLAPLRVTPPVFTKVGTLGKHNKTRLKILPVLTREHL
jgi:hypothetical protein